MKKVILLTSQIEELSLVNSWKEVEKETLKNKVTHLSAQRMTLDTENQQLKENLVDFSAGKKIDFENILRLETEINELKSRVNQAESFVVQQHKLGFEKALQQAKYFYKIPLDAGNFDVDKDFYKGELVPVGEIPYDESPEDEGNDDNGRDDAE